MMGKKKSFRHLPVHPSWPAISTNQHTDNSTIPRAHTSEDNKRQPQQATNKGLLMKTKPKLVRVLAPPLSLVVLGQQEPAALESDGEGGGGVPEATRRALGESLARSRPLAPIAFPGGGDSHHHHDGNKYTVQQTTLHPCRPWVAYAVFAQGEAGEASSGSGNHPEASHERNGWVVVQDTSTSRIVFSAGLSELAAEASAFRVRHSGHQRGRSGSDAKPAPPHLRSVVRLAFLDQAALYWNGFAGNASSNDGSNDDGDHHRSWSYLLVHFSNRVLVVDLKARGAGLSDAGFATAHPAPSAVVADVTPQSLEGATGGGGSSSSSSSTSSGSLGAALAVSRTKLLLACSDGTLGVYDWESSSILRSAGWAGAVGGFTDNPRTSDAIVRIVPANPYSYDPGEAMAGDGSSSQRPKRQTVVCLTKKEAAYLVDVGSPSLGSVLACMEGGSVFAHGHEGVLAFPSAGMDHTDVRYDAFRDLFFWTNPSKNGRSKLFVWDLAAVVASSKRQQLQQQQQQPGASKPPILRPDPVLVAQFSHEGLSHSVFPGWLHESFPSDSVACLLATKDGELQVSVAPLYKTNSSAKNPFPAAVVWSVELPRVLARDLRLGDRCAPGDVEGPRFKVRSVSCEPLRDPSTVFVGTTIGIQVVRLLDGLKGLPSPGTRCVYFNANAGNMGRSVLSLRGGQLSYSPLDPPPLVDGAQASSSSSTGSSLLGVDRVNPIGRMEYYSAGYSTGGSTGSSSGNVYGSLSGNIARSNTKEHRTAQKITSMVYESPPPLHLPLEIRSRRPFRNPPRFLLSPSGRFVCCCWKDELRYEILSVSVLLESVKDKNRNRNAGDGPAARNPLVAGGTGVVSFAWIGDGDVFSLLYDPEQDEALKAGINLGAPEASKGSDFYTVDAMIKNLGKIKTYKKGARAVVDTAGKLGSVEGLMDLGKDTGKLGKKGLKGMSRLAHGSATAVGAPIMGAGKIAVKGTKKGAKRVGKKMPFGWGKKKDKKGASSLASTDLESDDDEPTTATSPIEIIPEETDPEADERAASQKLEKKHPWVELRMLVGSTNEGDETAGGTTASGLGQLTLRTGGRNPPTILFGGPVLCVGSKFDENDEGVSHFYTKKKGQDEESASVYVSSGPSFPCPDIVAWDDDGKLCAVVIKGKVSVYLSDDPNFVLLGMAEVGSSSLDSGGVISARFLHGVLYCTTKTSVRCVFLGDPSGESSCHMDAFTLASCNVPILPSRSIVTDYDSLTPPTIPMPLHHPEILGYQNGSLVLSTTTGIVAVPLGFPLLRIGSLISAGSDYFQKAEQWFDAVPNDDHEALATFLERRGVPMLALNLCGLSLETTIDLCMRYGFVDRLEEVVELYGLEAIRAIDQSSGLSSNIFGPEEGTASLLVCVGAYLLSYGRIELVRRIATECLASGEKGKKEAFMLAGLLLSVNESDAKRVIHRSVENIEDNSDWVVGPFVRKHVLNFKD